MWSWEVALKPRGVCVRRAHSSQCSCRRHSNTHTHDAIAHTHTSALRRGYVSAFCQRGPGKSSHDRYGWSRSLSYVEKGPLTPAKLVRKWRMLPALAVSPTLAHLISWLHSLCGRQMDCQVINQRRSVFAFINEKAFLYLFSVTVWRHRRPMHSCLIICLSKPVNLLREK